MLAITDDFIVNMFASFYPVNDENILFGDENGNVDSYTFNNDVGSIAPLGDRFANLNFERIDQEYRLRVQLTPSSTGLHTILPVSREEMVDMNKSNIQKTDKTGKQIVLVNFSGVFNDGDNNFHLFSDNQNGVNAGSIDLSLKWAVYAFYVKE